MTEPAKCGTREGLRRHHDLGEPPCEACAAAQRDHMRERRKDPAVQAQDRFWTLTRSRAHQQLAREYPERFEAILRELRDPDAREGRDL